MTISESEIEIEARLTAIEYMLGCTLGRVIAMIGDLNANTRAVETDAQTFVSEASLPGADPDIAEIFAFEVSGSIQRMLTAMREQIGRTQTGANGLENIVC